MGWITRAGCYRRQGMTVVKLSLTDILMIRMQYIKRSFDTLWLIFPFSMTWVDQSQVMGKPSRNSQRSTLPSLTGCTSSKNSQSIRNPVPGIWTVVVVAELDRLQ